MSFSICESDVILCNNEQIIIYNIDNEREKIINLPELESDKKVDLHNNINIETFHTITNVTFSNDGRYFLICTNRKQLCLYERKNQNLLLNKTLPRAASKVKFTSNNDIVVADKTGDVYIFSGKQSDNGSLLLGHLSMILDVLVTKDQEYIITTDRDEKIRVSMFPNSYNIVSYCLGHKKFVTNVVELPHDKSVLMSCGGDGVFILWDYRVGKELLCIDFHDKIPTNDIERFNEQLRDCNLDESVQELPVKYLRLSLFDASSSLAVISFYNSSLLLVYKISSMSNLNVLAAYVQSIIMEYEPIEYHLYKNNMWLLNDLGFKVYEFKDDRFVLCDETNKIRKLNDYWKILKKDITQQNLFSILYKRKYDNVQEYLQRKKTRLTSIVDG
ncbi:tRNA (guanine-N(7)-)-methyltransferase non-catalytic subunit WDR4 [Ceratina calcarata]|uniref:tRNA (Guanine-N(7)-)-methyltransferase non-catalytic subunit WDR4 n=1 Tax=Ceratina calcarata TaxID=156304 RepID=A0AAJ7JAU0_9HYME|nr:tRNA (guanine-N(7)-)-methyltransferase non-catalytic subunit WDR4 [Ceratina calcarata]